MSNIEKIKAEIEKRREDIKAYCLNPNHDKRYDVVPEQLAYILSFIDSLPEEKPSDDLEEAAEISFDEAYALTEDYRDFLAKGLTENKPRPIGPHWFCEYAKKRFIAGAEWQKRHFTVEDIKTILDIAFWNNDPEKILDEYNRIKYGDQ